jgi:putative flippase GtrA
MKNKMWNKYFVTETNDSFIQFFRYLFVGGFAFIIDYAASLIFVHSFGIYPVYAASMSFILGLAANYLLCTKWIFIKRNITKQGFDFMAFAVIGVVGLAMKAGFVWFFTEVPHLTIELSNPIATLLVFVWNFLARKCLLYSKCKRPGLK